MLLLTACILPSMIQGRDPQGSADPAALHTPVASPTPARTQETVAPLPTFTPTPPSPTPTPLLLDPHLDRSQILLLPQPLHYGDHLTVDVDPVVPEFRSNQYTVTLQLPDGRSFVSPVTDTGLISKPQARFYWLAPFEEIRSTATFTVSLELGDRVVDPRPENNQVVLSVPLVSSVDLAPPEPDTQWAYTDTTGFRLHYLTGSAADRDLETIVGEANDAFRHITSRLGPSDQRVDVYVMDRVVGQGGFASSEWVAISYVDRKYVPIALGSLLRHELTHRLDGLLGCDSAPSVLREGLAVYLAGGHYRGESLRPRASALMASKQCLALEDLTVDFYSHQHEMAYLEAGAWVQYIVEAHGWNSISTACKASAQNPKDAELEQMQAALGALGYRSLGDAESAFRQWLSQPAVASVDEELLMGEFQLMDLVREYQRVHDTAAHFTEGVLFSPAEAKRLGITADFVRRPRSVRSISIELLLALGHEAVELRDLMLLDLCLDGVHYLLEGEIPPGDAVPPITLAEDVLEIVTQSLARGSEPYRLTLERQGRYRLQVLDLRAWPQPREMVAEQDREQWVVQ